jgi:C4-type Zn-finger protein
MKPSMTKAAKKRHLQSAGQDCCPYCKEDLLEYGDYEELSPVEDGTIEQIVGCEKCGRRWMDVFKLVDVQELA